jgi:GNAT superfamily N-acetyltransferase
MGTVLHEGDDGKRSERGHRVTSPKRGKVHREQPTVPDIESVRLRPLERRDWPLIESLFGLNGACGGCWCMYWHIPRGGKAWQEAKGEPNRAAFKELIESGDVHGILAMAGDTPIGWCAFGPAHSFPKLMRSRALARPRTDRTWSVVCFYIPAKYRRRGLAGKLLAAATERAFALGASEVEGFPAVPKSEEALLPGAFAYTGVPRMFRRGGFKLVPRAEGTRPIYVKTQVTSV